MVAFERPTPEDARGASARTIRRTASDGRSTQRPRGRPWPPRTFRQRNWSASLTSEIGASPSPRHPEGFGSWRPAKKSRLGSGRAASKQSKRRSAPTLSDETGCIRNELPACRRPPKRRRDAVSWNRIFEGHWQTRIAPSSLAVTRCRRATEGLHVRWSWEDRS